MAYRIDLPASARRHWKDGCELLRARRAQAAGYHFGFAAECAVKSVFYKHQIPRQEDRRDDPYWAHFPTLRTLLIRDGRGRLPAHLSDGFDMVTPRSFLTALRRAAEVSQSAETRVFTIEGLKEGLRAASRVRVDQLKEEYKWIELALVPLAGMRVPCDEDDIIVRWTKTKTADSIERDAAAKGYLPPSKMPTLGQTNRVLRMAVREPGLLATLLKTGVLERRPDNRINMPDIFRIGAALIGRGRVAPEGLA